MIYKNTYGKPPQPGSTCLIWEVPGKCRKICGRRCKFPPRFGHFTMGVFLHAVELLIFEVHGSVPWLTMEVMEERDRETTGVKYPASCGEMGWNQLPSTAFLCLPAERVYIQYHPDKINKYRPEQS